MCDLEYEQFYENNLMGIKREDGKIIVKAEYNFVAPLSDDAFQVIKGNKHGFVDLNGNEFIKPTDEVECYSDFSEGLAAFRKDGKWGYIDKKGKVVIKEQFQYCENFHDGLAKFSSGNGKFGFINKKGEVVIEEKFNYVSDFKNGYAIFNGENNDLVGMIDKTGKIILKPEFIYIGEVEDNKVVIQKQENDEFKEGIYTIGGNIEWNNNLEHINEFNKCSKQLSASFKKLVDFYYEKACPCSFKRCVDFITWQNEDRFFDAELLFGAIRQHLEKTDEMQDPTGEFAGIWEYECSKCKTTYRETWRNFSDNFEVTNIEILEYKAENLGALPPKNGKVPVVLGFAGYDDIIGKYDDKYEYTDIKTLIDYLKQIP